MHKTEPAETLGMSKRGMGKKLRNGSDTWSVKLSDELLKYC